MIFWLFGIKSSAQRVVWWNVENLFDCQHDSLKNDEEFLPEGAYHWTQGRYWKKLDNLSRTIAMIAGEDDWPMIVALGEVENDTVLRDLTRRSPLRFADYQSIHYESPDERGVDVALLYQPEQFLPLASTCCRVPSVEKGFRPTRDILHVKGLCLHSGDTIHLLAVHLPSRRGNTRKSSLHRQLAVATLCQVIDSLRQEKVLLMGDFNAKPSDAALKPLKDRMTSLVSKGKASKWKSVGTYYYRGLWSHLDHFWATSSLYNDLKSPMSIGRFPHLLTQEGIPFRTYQGPTYIGGISDHLPIWTDWLAR